MSNDSLGDRMKSGYEDIFRHHLPIRMPVILRVDGVSFHQYTKGCKRPVDQSLVDCMNHTALHLCQNIQGCQLAYIQSDEISLLLHNYKTLNTQAWFDNNIQKMVSVAASMAGTIFSLNSWQIWGHGNEKPAFFDCRAFVLPESEVCNAMIWRQQDSSRNSIQMLARSLFSHKECENKNSYQLQEMCNSKGINWNDLPTSQKRGRCAVRIVENVETKNPNTGVIEVAQRSRWTIDNEIPIFSIKREYIERHLEANYDG